MKANRAPKADIVSVKTQARRKRERWAKVGTHSALLVGCVVFSFPFYWLISTSVKENEEIQRDPPMWVPALPESRTASPFVEEGLYGSPDVPEGVNEAAFARFWPTVQQALWTWVIDNHSAEIAAVSESEARGPLVNALWSAVQAGTPPDTWRLSPDEVADAAVAPLTADSFERAWYQVYRSWGIRELVIEDTGFVRHTLPADLDELGAWQATSEGIELRSMAGQTTPALELVYDLNGRDSAVMELTVPLEIPSDEFRGVIIPVRHDHSWNALWVTAEVGPRKLQSTEPLDLTDHAWLDATFRLPDEDYLGFEVHDFVELADVGSSDVPEGEMRLTLELRRVGPLGAVYTKCVRNYRDALRYVPFWTYLGNTLWIVVLSIVGQVLSCSLIAFAFSRLRWPFRDACFGLLLATMMLPGQVTMVPQFLVFKYLGWYNTLLPLWLPAFFGSAFFIFMLRQFMKGIPNDLEDAAKIDGCSYLMIYWRIMLPLIKPALAAIAIFTFMGAWNNFIGPLIYVSDQRLYPLALGLFQFRTEHGADFGMLMAASALMTIPIVGIFFGAQRYFIEGVTLTGIKG